MIGQPACHTTPRRVGLRVIASYRRASGARRHCPRVRNEVALPAREKLRVCSCFSFLLACQTTDPSLQSLAGCNLFDRAEFNEKGTPISVDTARNDRSCRHFRTDEKFHSSGYSCSSRCRRAWFGRQQDQKGFPARQDLGPCSAEYVSGVIIRSLMQTDLTGPSQSLDERRTPEVTGRP